MESKRNGFFVNVQAAMEDSMMSERWVRGKIAGEWREIVTYVGREPRIARLPLYRLLGIRDEWRCPECVARETKP